MKVRVGTIDGVISEAPKVKTGSCQTSSLGPDKTDWVTGGDSKLEACRRIGSGASGDVYEVLDPSISSDLQMTFKSTGKVCRTY